MAATLDFAVVIAVTIAVAVAVDVACCCLESPLLLPLHLGPEVFCDSQGAS